MKDAELMTTEADVVLWSKDKSFSEAVKSEQPSPEAGQPEDEPLTKRDMFLGLIVALVCGAFLGAFLFGVSTAIVSIARAVIGGPR